MNERADPTSSVSTDAGRAGARRPPSRTWMMVATAAALAAAGVGCRESSSAALPHHFSNERDGIAVRYPDGWRLTTRNDSYVPNPALCFALSTQAGGSRSQLKVVEYLPPLLTADARSFYKPRPSRLRLPVLRAADSDWTRGRTLSFREHGRVILVGVVLAARAGPARRRTIEAILNSLEVRDGHSCRPSQGVGSQ
jgi:hypothetical protein